MQEVKALIRDVPDFPKPGIIFKDITPVLKSPSAFSAIIDALAERYQNREIDKIVGIESRGFIFASALSYRLKKGFVLVRKNGKLPWKKIKMNYDLEYGTDTIEIHEDSIAKNERVLIIDDVLATGGTAKATVELVKQMGGNLVEAAFVIELNFLKGRDKIKNVELFSLLQY